jgi:imidazolonepropionase-like amidohydrolase
VESGLTPRQALIGATSAAARAYGLSDRGRIAPGLRADLLLGEGDPTVDIKATRALRKIWKGGVEVARPLAAGL